MHEGDSGRGRIRVSVEWKFEEIGGVLQPFGKTTTTKHPLPSGAICCIKRGKAGEENVFACCNNDLRSGSKCKVRKGSVILTKHPKNCSDTSKPFHFTYAVATRALIGMFIAENLLGDGCCNVSQIHMIQFSDKHCCVTSNSPCSLKDEIPPCCGPPPGVCQKKRAD